MADDLPEIGDTAPDFTLTDDNGHKVTLSDFRGSKPVLIYFYPKAMTPGCTTQACDLRDARKDLETLDLVVLGISPDEPGALRKFREKEGLNFPLLSDPDHKVAESYGVWVEKNMYGKKSMGIQRASFLVGKDGRVLHRIPKVKADAHRDDVLRWCEQHRGQLA